MSTSTIKPGSAALDAGVRHRLAELRANPQRGSHATEYAIGIGLAAAVIIALFGAYQLGIDAIVAAWFFG
ncbi:hypothetical protein Dvina_51440 [Dactylosporangium vinaceum]|uniref:Uncharacterized protein n=1 Tax=Dactylosporangium vinaceum TaxID=53362 RepID=A0ABV5M2E6_9ACTN|nr:hypothetical protein [Dactylosporangium vinaceum]UAB96261.1 hypothetical protein Dvina_51440 [Dactylosporangium vinaceum]